MRRIIRRNFFVRMKSLGPVKQVGFLFLPAGIGDTTIDRADIGALRGLKEPHALSAFDRVNNVDVVTGRNGIIRAGLHTFVTKVTFGCYYIGHINSFFDIYRLSSRVYLLYSIFLFLSTKRFTLL